MKLGLDPEARWYHRQAVRVADAHRRPAAAAH